MKMRTWADLQEDMHCIAVSKGWWEVERSPLEVIMLMITELDECDDEFSRETGALLYDSRKVGEELADFVIRLGDAAGFYELALFPAPFPDRASERNTVAPAAAFFTEMVKPLAKAAEEFRNAAPNMAVVEQCFTTALTGAMIFADAYSIDLYGAVIAKMEINRSRPHRHGRAR